MLINVFRIDYKNVFAIIFSLHGLLFALSLAWCLLASNHFGYGFWHDNTGIAEAITKYAPQNKYKKGFEHTTREDRVAMFADINWAIHNGGEGLKDITYETPSSGGPQVLLREPEVVHLQDVANLIDVMFYPMVYGLFAWPVFCVLGIRQRQLPSPVGQVTVLGGVSVLGGLIILIIGAEKVFNQLHIWVFPDNHQWFFYYQESLMSTMMYAPNLFGWIALAWGLVSVVIYVGGIFILKALAKRFG